MKVRYITIESWASRLGYVVEMTERGYVWHHEDEFPRPPLQTVDEVIEAILQRLREEYKGDYDS